MNFTLPGSTGSDAVDDFVELNLLLSSCAIVILLWPDWRDDAELSPRNEEEYDYSMSFYFCLFSFVIFCGDGRCSFFYFGLKLICLFWIFNIIITYIRNEESIKLEYYRYNIPFYTDEIRRI